MAWIKCPGMRAAQVVALGVVVAAAIPTTARAQAEGPVPTVVVVPVVERAVSDRAEYVGRTRAYRRVDMVARVTGTLLERPVSEGDTVAADALVFRIDPAEFEAAVAAAEAEVERARAGLDLAVKELERAEALVKRGNIPVATRDQRAAEAAKARAGVSASEAGLTRARLDLGYTEIRSPIRGRIGEAKLDVGNLVGPEVGVLATVIATDPIYVTFSITGKELIQYRQAVAAGRQQDYLPSISLPTGEAFEQPGAIDFVDNEVDPLTGTIRVRALFPNPDNLLPPGQYVTVTLSSAEPTRRLMIPQASVQESQAGRFVLVVTPDSKVEQRPVVVGQTVGPDWVVESGLQLGETVIVEGVQKVRAGGTVTTVPREGS